MTQLALREMPERQWTRMTPPLAIASEMKPTASGKKERMSWFVESSALMNLAVAPIGRLLGCEPTERTWVMPIWAISEGLVVAAHEPSQSLSVI